MVVDPRAARRGLLGLPASVWSSGERGGFHLAELRLDAASSVTARFVRDDSREAFSITVGPRDDAAPAWLRLSRVQASYSGAFGEAERARYTWKRWIVEVLAKGLEELARGAGDVPLLEALGRRDAGRARSYGPEAVLELLSPFWRVGDDVFAGLRLGGARAASAPDSGAVELWFEGDDAPPSLVLVPRSGTGGARRGGAHVVVAARAGVTSGATEPLEALVGFALEVADSDASAWRSSAAEPVADTFCVLPWTMLDVKPQGQVLPCDLFARGLVSDDGEPFDVRRHSLASAWESADLARVRRAHAAGERLAECERCWRVEAEGGRSRRLGYLEELSQFVPLARTGQPRLAFLSLFPGNLCNLRCRTCAPGASSALIRETAEVERLVTLRGAPPNPRGPAVLENWLADNPVFWGSIDELFPGLALLEFLGGEPLVVEEHHELLARLVESGHASHVELRYVTNGTRVPRRAAELWPHFARVGLQVSLDAVGPRFEYLRHPAKWDAVARNLDRFRTIAERVDVTTNATFSLIGAFYVHELFAWTHARGLACSLNSFGEPRYLDPRSLPREAKRIVRERLSDPATPIAPSERPNVEGLLDLMDSEDWSAAELPAFWLRTRAHDEYRGERFEATFPELAALLDGWCSSNTSGSSDVSSEGSALRPAGEAVGAPPPGLGPRAPNGPLVSLDTGLLERSRTRRR